MTQKFLLLFSFCFLAISLSTFAIKFESSFNTTQDTSKVQHYTFVVDAYLEGLNTKNAAMILNLYADSAMVEDPVGSKIIKGKDALQQFYGGAARMDLKLTQTGAVRIAGHEAAFPFVEK